MVNVNSQQWLDEKYPEDGVCERKSDQINKGKTRKWITELDISKGKVGRNGNKDLTGDLKLEGFTNLRKLIISSQQIINLDLSECPNLTELDCQNNKLNNLNVTGCFNLENINCSNNSHIRELDVSTCTNLKEVDINYCPKLTANSIKSGLIFSTKKRKLVKGPLITRVDEESIRNILVVGITGSGKSALANTLSDTSDANKFKERCSSTSKTKGFQKGDIFDWEKNGQKLKYRLVDNIGFGDTTNISEEDILFKIGEGIHAAKEGINQILFVFKDRFSPEHITTFNLLEDFISETGITRFTTIVRTNFPNFRKPSECEKDQRTLLTQTKALSEIINACNGLVHVDNPPIPKLEEEDSDNEREIRVNTKKRRDSRKVLLDHLVENCQQVYKLKEWDNISSMVEKYKEAEQELVNDKDNKEKLEEVKSNLFKELRVKLGLSFPGLPIGFEAQIEVIK